MDFNLVDSVCDWIRQEIQLFAVRGLRHYLLPLGETTNAPVIIYKKRKFSKDTRQHFWMNFTMINGFERAQLRIGW